MNFTRTMFGSHVYFVRHWQISCVISKFKNSSIALLQWETLLSSKLLSITWIAYRIITSNTLQCFRLCVWYDELKCWRFRLEANQFTFVLHKLNHAQEKSMSNNFQVFTSTKMLYERYYCNCARYSKVSQLHNNNAIANEVIIEEIDPFVPIGTDCFNNKWNMHHFRPCRWNNLTMITLLVLVLIIGHFIFSAVGVDLIFCYIECHEIC